MMEYRHLGRSGLRVSKLCLGTAMFGVETDARTAAQIIHHARDAGVNFIDTGDMYNAGRSEQIIGETIADHRDSWVLATKLGNPTSPDPNGFGLSRLHIQHAIRASLARLRTDVIDVLYFHREDLVTPLPESVHTIADAIRAGQIRYFGLSNFSAWRVAAVCHLCDELGIDRPIVSQPYYNALNRTAEREHLPACAAYGLGVYVYSPLARGLLTGKYRPEQTPPAATRAGRGDQRILQTEWHNETLRAAQALAEHANARGVLPAHLAIGWVLANRLITGVVAGPRTLEQWQAYVEAVGHRINADDEAFIDRLVASGHPSTPGYNDPSFPFEGRIVNLPLKEAPP